MVGGFFLVGEEWAKFWPMEGGIPTIPPVVKTLDAATLFYNWDGQSSKPIIWWKRKSIQGLYEWWDFKEVIFFQLEPHSTVNLYEFIFAVHS